MNIEELKKKMVEEDLGLSEDNYGRVLCFIDFGNVNFWFKEDRQKHDHQPLKDDEIMTVDLVKMQDLTALLFGCGARFYYGFDADRVASLDFIKVAKNVFGKHQVFTKPIQKVRHHLASGEILDSNASSYLDEDGPYIKIYKCNFDVEIAVDAMRLIDKYDTICLFSGDADFTCLLRFLKTKGKKTILVKAGRITSDLRKTADLVINAQNLKKHVVRIGKKRKPGG